MLNSEDNDMICRTGRDTPGGKLMRRYWIPAVLGSELPGPDCPPVRVRLLGEDLVAFRDSSGRVGLLAANCPHRGASLFFGRNEKDGLRCVYHGWKFDVAGNCVDMPNEPSESTYKQRIKQVSYPCIERGRIVWTYMGPETNPPPLPDFQFLGLPDEQITVIKIYQEQNWLQGIEGSIDPSHAPFLHSAAVDSFQSDAVSALRTERIADYYWSTSGWTYDAVDLDYGMMLAAHRQIDDRQNFWRMNVFLLPFYAMGPVRTGADPVSNLQARVPVDDENHFTYSITYHPLRPLTEEEIGFNLHNVYVVEQGFENPDPDRPGREWLLKANKRNDYMLDRHIQRTQTFTGIPGIAMQDQAVTESMGPIANRTGEHLVRADLGIVMARRVFLRAARALREGATAPPGVEGSGYNLRAPSKLLPRAETNWREALIDYYTCLPDRNPSLP